MRGVFMGVDVGTSFFASALDSYKPRLQSFSNLELYLERLGCILNLFPDNTNGMKACLPPTPPPTQLHVTGEPGEHSTEPGPEVPEPRRTAHLPSGLPA